MTRVAAARFYKVRERNLLKSVCPVDNLSAVYAAVYLMVSSNA